MNSRQQAVVGAANVDDVDRIMADAPMLQAKMKPRHLTMIAVGTFTAVHSFGKQVSTVRLT